MRGRGPGWRGPPPRPGAARPPVRRPRTPTPWGAGAPAGRSAPAGGPVPVAVGAAQRVHLVRVPGLGGDGAHDAEPDLNASPHLPGRVAQPLALAVPAERPFGPPAVDGDGRRGVRTRPQVPEVELIRRDRVVAVAGFEVSETTKDRALTGVAKAWEPPATWQLGKAWRQGTDTHRPSSMTSRQSERERLPCCSRLCAQPTRGRRCSTGTRSG